ncbi:hypothetical protein HUT19_41150 [Streptomyces sp. NA02950]|uniref:hypothetical protein n=1 Tax=Streptomyces sp. NA02950 TaxID=2742137 RepID=UPI0015911B1D|nr:hypothetical protein [Streptomyces sp. NA02950]QKV90377.1 hypothetical protein HUT19_00070 [Streptomyces sp. NA02950]QKV97290.1 hypothetical protein HUT19_41150 [Streptomyces sp. NA02950]
MSSPEPPATPEPITVTVQHEGTAFTLTLTLHSMERRLDRGVLGDVDGIEAHLKLASAASEKPSTLFLSRLAGEKQWVIDAKFGANGFPHFCHGFGARYLRCTAVVDEIGDVLDQAARDRGLAEQIGRDIPLVPVPIKR